MTVPAAVILPTAHPTPGAGELLGNLPCIRCGYNLRGLPFAEDAKCPECGLRVRSTLNKESVLSLSDSSWVTTLRGGATLLLFAAAQSAVVMFILGQSGQSGDSALAAVFTPAGARPWLVPYGFAGAWSTAGDFREAFTSALALFRGGPGAGAGDFHSAMQVVALVPFFV